MLNKFRKAYGLENLCFYKKNGQYHCKYVSDSSSIKDEIQLYEFDYLLKSLSAQQGHIFFDDIGETCVGIDELKHKYLVFKLAGI